MTKETGTLAELNVKPGDVVECVGLSRPANIHYVTVGKQYTIRRGGQFMDDEGDLCGGHTNVFRIVSRASDTPKTWGEMTDEEKGAILLAGHEGRPIDLWTSRGEWITAIAFSACDNIAYRVRPPEPKRETVTLYGAPSKHIQWCLEQCGLDTHRITMPFFDGNIPAGTYTSEEGETIIVEEL